MPSASPTKVHPSPGVFRRVAAFVYDFLLLCAVWFGSTLVLLAFRGGVAIPPNALWYPIYLLTLAFMFFAWFWTHGGQTLGMKAWKIRMVTLDGAPVTWRHAAVRFLSGVMLFGLGLLWSIFDADKQTLYDRLSSTQTIRK